MIKWIKPSNGKNGNTKESTIGKIYKYLEFITSLKIVERKSRMVTNKKSK